MRVLIVLCACVTLAKCGPQTTTTGGTEFQQPRIIGLIGNPVGGSGGGFGNVPLQILPAGFLSNFNQQSLSQPLGKFQPFLHQPVVTSPPKRQVSQADATAATAAASATATGEVSTAAASSAVTTAAAAPAQIVAPQPNNIFAAAPAQTQNFAIPSNQFASRSGHQIFATQNGQIFAIPSQHQSFAAQPQQQSFASPSNNQILGVLKPSTLPSQSTDILSNLLPEFIEITNKLEQRGLTGKGRTQAEETVKAFMPLMRKIMISNAQVEGRSLTQQEVDAINFAEKTVGPFVTFGWDVSDQGKGFTNPALPKNDVPNDFFAQMMVDLIPDLTRIVKQVKNQYAGWPGTGSAVEVMNLFMPFARRVVESQARIEGRFITREEQDYLRFGEDVVPLLMKYAQESFITGKSLETAEKYNIAEVVQNAWNKLKKAPKL